MSRWIGKRFLWIRISKHGSLVQVVTPRKEVREGRSFNLDEFAIALEQVVAGNAPEDYRDPEKSFPHTCFTPALKDHAAMVLERLSVRLKGPPGF